MKSNNVARLLLALAFLMITPPRLWADDYVIYHSSGGYLAMVGTSLTSVNTFDPNTCIWTGTSGGKFYNKNSTETSRYLQRNSTTLQLSNEGNGTNWTIANNQIYSNGYYIRYYIWYYNNWSLSNGTNSTDVNRRGTVYTVTYASEVAGTPTVVTHDPTISIAPASASVTYLTNVNFTVTSSRSVTTTTPITTPETYTFNSTPFYKQQDGTWSTTNPGTYNTVTVATEYPASYAWSIDGGASPYATINASGSTATVSYTNNYTASNDNFTVTATARYANNDESTETATVTLLAPNVVAQVGDLSQMNGSSGYFVLTQDIDASSLAASIESFSGTLDGGYHKITGLTVPLFATVDGGTVRNLVLDNVQVTGTGTGTVGAICGSATGAARIYNCGVTNNASRVQGGTYVGSLVGQLSGTARVINCYSFATITGGSTGGSTVGGIVGYNADTVPTEANPSTVNTMVMNCMFYGDITGGTNKYPVYGGNHIQNRYLPNYNYYAYDKFTATISAISLTDNNYNSALAAEDRYLKRFEFYRGILNSNRRMAAWYISGNTADTALVAKWVLDESIAEYPILKRWGKYPSVVNRASYQAGQQAALQAQVVTPSTDLSVGTDRYEGKCLGVLTVTLKKGTYGSGSDQVIYLPITDMDTNHFDYNYYKVQLPYYNDYFTGNYGDYAVTGWDVTSVTGGTVGSLDTTGDNAYNFADRNCTAKDQQRTFAQGGFYHVPEGVTAITLTAHWGRAVYLSQTGYDYSFQADVTSTAFTAPGTDSNTYGTTDYRATDWMKAAAKFKSGSTVYDNVIVLVSNMDVHTIDWNAARYPYTIMSIDENRDNEPDFCLYQEFDERKDVDAIRFDFVYNVGLGMAKKDNQSASYHGIGIFHPKGWFEVTETALARYSEFEYDEGRSVMAPLILNAGIVDQIVSAHYKNSTNTQYVILGGHLWMKAYTPGCHTDGTASTIFAPVSVTGGEICELYLTGMKPEANTCDVDGRIYTNGGKMNTFAASYQQQLNGNVYARFDHSIVHEFYGGGTNADKPVTGNINVTVNNSVVSQYVGGPKFGYVADGKTVVTNATGTVFGYFYGASYGGTSLNKNKANDKYDGHTFEFSWLSDYFNTPRLNSGANGILTGYEIEFFFYAGGRYADRRIYQTWASMSLSTTRNVTSTLNSCYVKNDFYGGGRIGKVQGDDTSTLTNCIVDGNVYAGGFSAAIPTCEVMNTADSTHVPTYNQYGGIFNPIVYPATVSYTWDDKIDSVDSSAHKLPTNENLSDLGKVVGNTSITIDGGHVKGMVFGGGNASPVEGNTNVLIKGPARIDINVYGGGNNAEVTGNTNVSIGE